MPWPSYYVKIVVHPQRFEVLPKSAEVPQCVATTEEFIVSADWGDNAIPDSAGKRKWRRIVVGNFRLVDPPGNLGSYTLPSQQVIEDQDYDPRKFKFNGFSSSIPRLVVAYDIDFVPNEGAQHTYTLDPVVIIRPDPGTGSMSPSG